MGRGGGRRGGSGPAGGFLRVDRMALPVDDSATQVVGLLGAAQVAKTSDEGIYAPAWTTISGNSGPPLSVLGIYMRSGAFCSVTIRAVGVFVPSGESLTFAVGLPFPPTAPFTGAGGELLGSVSTPYNWAPGQVGGLVGSTRAAVEIRSQQVYDTTIDLNIALMYRVT